MDILNSWPWADYEVELFCIEFSMGIPPLVECMSQKNYVPWIQTGGNILFCKKESLDSDNFKNSMAALDNLKS